MISVIASLIEEFNLHILLLQETEVKDSDGKVQSQFKSRLSFLTKRTLECFRNFGVDTFRTKDEGNPKRIESKSGVCNLVAHSAGMNLQWSGDEVEDLHDFLSSNFNHPIIEYDDGTILLDLSSELTPVRRFRLPVRRRVVRRDLEEEEKYEPIAARTRGRTTQPRKQPLPSKLTRNGRGYGVMGNVREEKEEEEELLVNEEKISSGRRGRFRESTPPE